MLLVYPLTLLISIGAYSPDDLGEFLKVTMWVSIIFIILIVYIIFYQILYYYTYHYDISKDTLAIRKGVIGKKQIYLPFDKIENVFMDQDLTDRMLGIYDVHLSTVGRASASMCHIDGLVKENADKMLAVLLRQVKENNKK